MSFQAFNNNNNGNTSSNNQNRPFRKIGAVWERTNRQTNETYLIGEIELTPELQDYLVNQAESNQKGNKVVRVSFNKNSFKETEKQPDLTISIREPRPQY